MSAPSQRQFLEALVHALDAAGIPYMVCGSLGSSFHGQPRATNDVDLVISATPQQLERFLSALGEGFYADGDAALQACRSTGTFNVIQAETGWKADLILRKQRPFSHEEFRRRRPADIMGMRLQVVSAEDAILSKLEWAKESGSERQFRDAVGVGLIQRSSLDREYLCRWARELGVEALLARLWQAVERLA